MLSCSCRDDYEWHYKPPEDFCKLTGRKRRPRCRSCDALINMGDDCLEFESFREPRGWYEESRFGSEVPMASKYLCEKCGEIFLNLNALGYCIALGDSMKDLLADYWDLTGVSPAAIKGLA